MKKILITMLIVFSFALSGNSYAASGCLYPASLDSIAQKQSGDFLTVAEVNVLGCAIEKLEAGPLRPYDGSLAAPGFAFRTDPGTGIFRSGASTIDIIGGGARAARMVGGAGKVNWVDVVGAVTGGSPALRGVGLDTDVNLSLDTQGAGSILFFQGGAYRGLMNNGLFLWGTSVVSGAAIGDVIIGTNNWLRSSDAAGTGTVRLIQADGNNRTYLAPSGADLRIGSPIVGNGGGATATIGTIGGQGPASAGQDGWIKFYDSNDAVFFVPVWR